MRDTSTCNAVSVSSRRVGLMVLNDWKAGDSNDSQDPILNPGYEGPGSEGIEDTGKNVFEMGFLYFHNHPGVPRMGPEWALQTFMSTKSIYMY